MRQLLRIVAIVETVSDGSSLRGGDVVVDLQVGCLAIINDANAPEAMFGVAPPLEDDFAVEITLQPVALKNTYNRCCRRLQRIGGCWSGQKGCGPCEHLVVVC